MQSINPVAVWVLGFLAVVMAAHGVLSVLAPQRQVDLRTRMGRPTFSATGIRIVGVFEIVFALAIGVVLAVTVARGS